MGSGIQAQGREFLTHRKQIYRRGKAWWWEGAILLCSWVGKGHLERLGRVSSPGVGVGWG